MFNSATSRVTSLLQAKTVTASSAMKQKAEAEKAEAESKQQQFYWAHNEQKFIKKPNPPILLYTKNFKHLTP